MLGRQTKHFYDLHHLVKLKERMVDIRSKFCQVRYSLDTLSDGPTLGWRWIIHLINNHPCATVWVCKWFEFVIWSVNNNGKVDPLIKPLHRFCNQIFSMDNTSCLSILLPPTIKRDLVIKSPWWTTSYSVRQFVTIVYCFWNYKLWLVHLYGRSTINRLISPIGALSLRTVRLNLG